MDGGPCSKRAGLRHAILLAMPLLCSSGLDVFPSCFAPPSVLSTRLHWPISRAGLSVCASTHPRPGKMADELVGQPGTRHGYRIVKQLVLPESLPQSDCRDRRRMAQKRAHLATEGKPSTDVQGMSVAAALTLLWADEFPSMSSARKRIRRGEVLRREPASLSSQELTMSSSLTVGVCAWFPVTVGLSI